MVGDGFDVRNMFPSNNLGSHISPFLLLDYAGPTYYAPTDQPRGVGEHPHRGFETVTIVYQGAVDHRDSAGNSGTIGPGDVQWMTAASGVVHEEKHQKNFAEQGGTLEAIQLWVNLPKAFKKGASSVSNHSESRHSERVPGGRGGHTPGDRWGVPGSPRAGHHRYSDTSV
jgi:redox-sensitive bicupin YhaK (pirin superfamily)